MSPESIKEILIDRAQMLSAVRSYFKERSVLEIDCCALTKAPPLDANIEVMTVSVSESETGYLHTSPEYAMKRLLSLGSKDIYYLGHVFRKGEIGRFHNPEFSMIEWYRIGIDYSIFIDETCDLIRLFLGNLPSRRLSYQKAFLLYAGFDPFEAIDCPKEALRLGIEPPLGSELWDKDTWLHLFLSHVVEPRLGEQELTILCEYPPSQAALSRIIKKDGRLVAERFEIYSQGVELSNGYHELSCAREQRRRFEKENQSRATLGKERYPPDERFLAALDQGLPDCCGVSVGFDRLMLLRHKQKCLANILTFAWKDPE